MTFSGPGGLTLGCFAKSHEILGRDKTIPLSPPLRSLVLGAQLGLVNPGDQAKISVMFPEQVEKIL